MVWIAKTELAVATDRTTAALVETPVATETKRVLDDRYANREQINGLVSEAIAQDPTLIDAAVDVLEDVLDETGIPRSVLTGDTDFEIAVGDKDDNATWMRSDDDGMPTLTVKVALGVPIRQSTDPGPDIPFGVPYTWFKTDPTTGQVIDWLEGTGGKF